VLVQRPSERIKIIDLPSGQVIRAASGDLDARYDVCVVRYHLWRLEDGNLQSQVREQHRMRYFFGPELEMFLGGAGFELVRLGAFPVLEQEANDQTWDVALVARAT